jgi:hypothetical protein
MYKGEWMNGMMNGKGEFTYPDGRKYIGYFINDKKEGKGEFIWNEGITYLGDWKDGK